MSKKEQKERKSQTEPIKIAQVVYGTKSFTDCMEAVIKTCLMKRG